MSFAFVPVNSKRSGPASKDQRSNCKKAYSPCIAEPSFRPENEVSDTSKRSEKIVCVNSIKPKESLFKCQIVFIVIFQDLIQRNILYLHV